ncbi:MAG: TldD/PmbA family protein [Chloroflexi bacterium]|nr:TldD/PmbA family protein [Chloroflexota bacterium]
MILEKVLERALGVAEEAEVFQVSSQETPAIFEANRLKSLETRETTSVALRIIKGNRIGFASTSNLRDLDALVEHALEVAPFGPVAHLQFPGKRAYPDVAVYDAEVASFPVDGLVSLGNDVIRALRTGNPDVLWEGRVSKSVATVSLVNSRGTEVSYTRTVFAVGMEGLLVQGTDMLFVYEGESSCRPIVDTTPIQSSLEEQLALARAVVPPVAGPLPVVLTPHGVAGMLLMPLLSGFNGQTVLQGASPLAGRLGEKVVDERITLRDDPTVPYIPGSHPSDDEGVPTTPKPLLDRGVASTFLYDLQTAAQAGTKSTGNASRWTGAAPSPAASVLLLQEGDASYPEMVKDMAEGLVVERLLGAGQSNVLAGDFHANVLLGYRVSKGKVLGRVKDTMISGNVYQVLNNLLGIGKASRWIGGWFKTPALYCGSLSVTARPRRDGP